MSKTVTNVGLQMWDCTARPNCRTLALGASAPIRLQPNVLVQHALRSTPVLPYHDNVARLVPHTVLVCRAVPLPPLSEAISDNPAGRSKQGFVRVRRHLSSSHPQRLGGGRWSPTTAADGVTLPARTYLLVAACPPCRVAILSALEPPGRGIALRRRDGEVLYIAP
jgi:hypothetical protein